MLKQNPGKLPNIHRRVAKGAEKVISFLIVAETPAIKNHHAFGNLKNTLSLTSEMSFLPFRPLSEKEKPNYGVLCVLCISNERSEWAGKAED